MLTNLCKKKNSIKNKLKLFNQNKMINKIIINNTKKYIKKLGTLFQT